MLNERAQLLLKTLVEHYISEGQPVGSRSLSRYSGLKLSPATIRNVMADLEDLGFVASPHTSAGRVPTRLGYRFFVDSLLVVKPIEEERVHQLEERFQPDNPSRLISSASQLLSQLTRFAGVVVAPRREGPTFRHVEFMRLADKRILLILVTPDGDVQNRLIVTERVYTQSELTEAANFLNSNYLGLSFDEIRGRLQHELRKLRQDMMELMTAAIDAGSRAAAESDDVVVSGEHQLLHVSELSSDMERLRRLFELFEQKTGLVKLMELSRSAEGVQIFIGEESGMVPLDECSVVTAPFTVDGRVVGTLGVVGPTRMAYDRVIPIVDLTAKLLTAALSR